MCSSVDLTFNDFSLNSKTLTFAFQKYLQSILAHNVLFHKGEKASKRALNTFNRSSETQTFLLH